MNPSDLIDSARRRAGGVSPGLGRPRQTDLQRAVSDTYYAIFHTLATCCADMLIGTGYLARRRPEWRQIYRALEHGYARRQCSNNAALAEYPTVIRRFARHFSDTQRLRHLADYDPDATFVREDVLQIIDEAERIIAEFNDAPADRRRAFAVHVLFRTRAN